MGFQQVIDANFNDPNISFPATYYAGGTGPGAPIRVIPTEPDKILNFEGETKIRTATLMLEVRKTDVAAFAKNSDTILFNAVTYAINWARLKDSFGLVWLVSTRGP